MQFLATGTVLAGPAELGPLMEEEDRVLAELKEAGVVTHAVLRTDHAKVFLTVEADDEASARTQLDRLPFVPPKFLSFELEPVMAI